MSYGLPDMKYSDGITKRQQLQFRGYNHNPFAQDGEIWDMENMSADAYPLLQPRKSRHRLQDLGKPNGIFSADGLYWVDGTALYRDGVQIGQVSDNRKRWAAMGRYVLILPDKLYFDTQTEELKPMEASWSGQATLKDGTYAGIQAKGNTLYAQGQAFATLFRVGDAVTISGCTLHPENNKTPIIREIDGENLRFYENVFTVGEGGDAETVTVKREMPELEMMCQHEGRLWGCAGDTIYSSKQNDPLNWNVFDGLTDDSFFVPVSSPGAFTGCISYRGYVYFFKEDAIYRIYGDRPSNFQVMPSASLGVAVGSERSLAVAGETLFYLSRAGVMAFAGGVPQSVAQAFGQEIYCDGVAGSDGTKYYISMKNSAGVGQLFVYDTASGLWHREDETRAVGFAWADGLHCLTEEGMRWTTELSEPAPEDTQTEAGPYSWVEFGDFTEADPNKKGVSKLHLRMELEEGAMVDILLQFDSNGVWHNVRSLTAGRKRSYYLPIVPRRCDHFRIKIKGFGQWRLFSLAKECYSGSEL